MVLWIHLLLGLATVAATTSNGNPYCCPEDYHIIRNKMKPNLCWHPRKKPNFIGISLTCNETRFFTNDTLEFHLDEGFLILELPNVEVEYEPDTFCISYIATNTSDPILKSSTLMAIVCTYKEENVIEENVYGICMIISSVLLLLTALIYTTFPELRDLQGKSIINFCTSLGIGLGILAAMKVTSYSAMNLCAIRGFLTYFFIIASFFWTNAISIQILFSITRPTAISYGWNEFTFYAVYAWGCSAILTLLTATVNYVPGDHLKPGIGLGHCWFFNKYQQWLYMYSVISMLIAVNTVIFIYTSIQLWRHPCPSSHIKALRYKFNMMVRLFIVMGISWIFEMISSTVKSHIIWEILDIINSLQGVLIFLVLVVFRRRVIKILQGHGCLDCVSGPVERCLAVGEDEEEVVHE